MAYKHVAAAAIVFYTGLLMTTEAYLTAPLDGGGNNVANPLSGKTGSPFARLSPLTVRYSDGFSSVIEAPNPRNVVSW
jgi:hypothetical protein